MRTTHGRGSLYHTPRFLPEDMSGAAARKFSDSSHRQLGEEVVEDGVGVDVADFADKVPRRIETPSEVVLQHWAVHQRRRAPVGSNQPSDRPEIP